MSAGKTDSSDGLLGNSFEAQVRQSYGDAEAAKVLRAYAYAVERLEDEADRHLRAADVLLDQRAEAIVVTAALLSLPHQRGDLSADEIALAFGDEITRLVARASADDVLTIDDEACQIEGLREWLTSISADIRTAVLRVGLRLGTLEALAERIEDGEQDDDPKAVARETLDLYVPLADRIGMGALRTRLEDACFRLLQPAVHAEMTRSIESIRKQDQICLSLLEDGVTRLLEQRGVDATVQSRTKGLYSIYRKMCRLDRCLDDVMDRIGLRIIVPSIEACYQVLGHLHTRFRPVPGTFDDYIGFPKENGYQSLHTCVYPVPDVSAKAVEFQIRTEAMHREAEYGVAAHWLYKNQEEDRAEDRRQLEELRQLLPESDKGFDFDAFLDRLHRRVHDDRLVVFRHQRHHVRLPANTTVRDLVRQLVGPNEPETHLRINGACHSPDYLLRDGDSPAQVTAEKLGWVSCLAARSVPHSGVDGLECKPRCQ